MFTTENKTQNDALTAKAGYAMIEFDGVILDIQAFVQGWCEWTEEFVSICHEFMRVADSSEEDILQAHYDAVVGAAIEKMGV